MENSWMLGTQIKCSGVKIKKVSNIWFELGTAFFLHWITKTKYLELTFTYLKVLQTLKYDDYGDKIMLLEL